MREEMISLIVRLIRAGERAYGRKWSFLGVFVLIFFGSVFILSQLNLLPDAPTVSAAQNTPTVALVSQLASADMTVASSTDPELPTKILIPAINLAATIADPTTTDATILDQDLLKGAVRYPTSAELNETGNIVIFGHSSYLPVVLNQAYKTFDGIQKLAIGDTIILYSSDMAYTYQVKTVTKQSANDAEIPLTVSGQMLTLSTCDSFAVKTDRFVVTADFVGRNPVFI